YVLRDNARNSGSRDKSAYVLVPKRDEHLHSDKSNTTGSASGADVVEENSGVTEFTDSGKKKILLLKGKEREIPHISGNISQMKNVMGSSMSRQNHRQEGSGRIIKSILVNKEARQGLSAFQSDNQTQTSYLDREKRPPRAPNVQVVSRDANGFPEEKSSVTDSHGFGSEKQERRTRNKDRPDRGVWAPLRRSDGSHASDESISSASSSVKSLVDSSEGKGIRVAWIANLATALFMEVTGINGKITSDTLKYFAMQKSEFFQIDGAISLLWKMGFISLLVVEASHKVGKILMVRPFPLRGNLQRGEVLLDMVPMRSKCGFKNPALGRSHFMIVKQNSWFRGNFDQWIC
ncbi:hypothetical protein CRG98_004662, partial [Punica granatum]